MSLLPSFAQTTIETGNETAEAEKRASLSEWNVDLETGQLTGETTDGLQAVKVWIWKALMTEKFRYALYSWQYGSELESYIGKRLTPEYLKTDVRLALEDVLLINEEIRQIRNYTARAEKGTLFISFTAVTDFGEISIMDFSPKKYVSKDEKAKDKAILSLRANTARFRIAPDGRLHWKRPASFDRSVKIRIDEKGILHAVQTESFRKAVKLKREKEEVEAQYDV